MVIDDKLVFSDGQDLSSDTGTIESTNYLKLADSGIDFGEGSPLKLKVAITTAITAATDIDVSFGIAECATTDGTYTTVVKGETLSGGKTATDLAEGEVYTVTMPPGDRQQYLKAVYTVLADTNASTVSPAAGVVVGWLTNE